MFKPNLYNNTEKVYFALVSPKGKAHYVCKTHKQAINSYVKENVSGGLILNEHDQEQIILEMKNGGWTIRPVNITLRETKYV